MSEEYHVILIRSASHAMRGEHLLTQAGMQAGKLVTL